MSMLSEIQNQTEIQKLFLQNGKIKESLNQQKQRVEKLKNQIPEGNGLMGLLAQEKMCREMGLVDREVEFSISWLNSADNERHTYAIEVIKKMRSSTAIALIEKELQTNLGEKMRTVEALASLDFLSALPILIPLVLKKEKAGEEKVILKAQQILISFKQEPNVGQNIKSIILKHYVTPAVSALKTVQQTYARINKNIQANNNELGELRKQLSMGFEEIKRLLLNPVVNSFIFEISSRLEEDTKTAKTLRITADPQAGTTIELINLQ